MRRIIMASITAVVVIAVLAGTLIPILDDATATHETFRNDGGFYQMIEITPDDEDYTLSWVKSNTTVLTINGTDYDANAAYGAQVTTIIAGDDWLIRYNSSNNTNGYCQFYNGTAWLGDYTSNALTVEASNGTATITHVNASDVSTTRTATYTKMYAIMPDSTDDIMKKPTQTPYVLGDSPLYAMGVTTGISGLIKIDGNIDDGVTIDVIGTTSDTITNIVIDKQAVSDYNDLYMVNKITFDVEIDGTTTSCTYNYFIVPYEVTAEKSVHFTDGENAIFNAIPVIVIVALLLAVIAIVLRSRMD